VTAEAAGAIAGPGGRLKFLGLSANSTNVRQMKNGSAVPADLIDVPESVATAVPIGASKTAVRSPVLVSG
jgi:hypothetical protein